MKPVIFLILLVGLTIGMVVTSSTWLAYGNPNLTIFGMGLISILLEMNAAPEDHNLMIDGEINNSKMLLIMIISSAIMFGMAMFVAYLTAMWVAVIFMSFYFVKSTLMLIMGPFDEVEDVA
ncbi:hypothetical protein KAU11_12610 [Candidatus Babeliales bacterium]|nr:hypothetical protein [Candidatus Babeliales bacterium]